MLNAQTVTQEKPPQYYGVQIQEASKDHVFYQLQGNLFIP